MPFFQWCILHGFAEKFGYRKHAGVVVLFINGTEDFDSLTETSTFDKCGGGARFGEYTKLLQR